MQALYLMKKGVALSFASCSLLIKFIVYQFVLTLYSAVTLALCFRQFAGRVPLVGWLAAAGFGINLLVIVGLLCLGFFAQTDRTVFVWHSFAVAAAAPHKRADGAAGKRSDAKGAGRILPGLCSNPPRFLGNPSDVPADRRAADRIFLVPLCIFYAFGIGRADVLLMVCAGAFVLNFTSFIPLPGAAAGAEIGFHTVFGLFFLPASSALPSCCGGCSPSTSRFWWRGVHHDGRGLEQGKKENFSLIHPLVRGIIKEPQTTALRIDGIITL